MGPEYLAILLTAAISAVSGGTWVSSKVLARFHERNQLLNERMGYTEKRLTQVEDSLTRLPVEYVLKVDFLREIHLMHDQFKEINTKLDRMIETLLR
jgi:hypothetical protein